MKSLLTELKQRDAFVRKQWFNLQLSIFFWTVLIHVYVRFTIISDRVQNFTYGHVLCPCEEWSYRRIAVYAAYTVEIDRCQTLIRQAVVKAASWTIAPFLVCVVQRHLKHIHAHWLIFSQKQIDRNTHTHTHTQSQWHNPPCADGRACQHSSEIMGML